jgi:hypothetical protein
MAYFQTKNPTLGQVWRAVDWKTLTYFMAKWIFSTDIRDILRPFGKTCVHLAQVSFFGIMHQKNLATPVVHCSRLCD